MKEHLYIVTNQNYQHEAAYPDASRRLKEIEQLARIARMEVEYVWLQFRPSEDTTATASIIEQTRKALRSIEPGSRIVTLMGDGGNGTWLRAKQILNADEPAHARDKIFIAPGGTMNLIAKALGVKLDHLCWFLGANNQPHQAVLLRELIVDLNSGKKVHIPWGAFAGVGFDGWFLEQYERKSRANHVLRNVFDTARDLAPSVIGSKDAFTWDMALAVSQLGLIKFPTKLDRLSDADFHRIQLGPVEGNAAAIKGIALQVTGFHPAIAEFYWHQKELAELLDVLPGHATFRDLIASVQPKISNGHHQAHKITGPFHCHADGFPHRFDEGAADYQFVTLPEPGVKVFSPRVMNKSTF